MQSLTLVLFAALVTVAYAGGQFYVPRAYYTIDSDGHESAPVPLRRLRRSLESLPPLPYGGAAGSPHISNIEGHGSYGHGSYYGSGRSHSSYLSQPSGVGIGPNQYQ